MDRSVEKTKRTGRANRVAMLGEIQQLQEDMSHDAVRRLAVYAASATGGVRREATEALCSVAVKTHMREAVVLARLAARAGLSDPNWTVRDVACEALGDLGTKSDVFRLEKALGDPDWCVRCSAVASIAFLGAPRGLEPIAALLASDPSSVVRKYAAVALGGSGDSRWLPVLLGRLTAEKAADARYGLLAALVDLGYHEARRELVAMLLDTEPKVLEMVMNHLLETWERLGWAEDITPEITEQVKVIVASSSRVHIRDLGHELLRRLGLVVE